MFSGMQRRVKLSVPSSRKGLLPWVGKTFIHYTSFKFLIFHQCNVTFQFLEMQAILFSEVFSLVDLVKTQDETCLRDLPPFQYSRQFFDIKEY